MRTSRGRDGDACLAEEQLAVHSGSTSNWTEEEAYVLTGRKTRSLAERQPGN